MPSSHQLSIGNAKNVLSAVTGVNLQKYGNASLMTMYVQLFYHLRGGYCVPADFAAK